MVKRTCPACGATRYSADDISEWMCECGRRLTPELNEAPERKTDTEKAMAHFEALQKRYTTQHNGKQCELVATALSALREQDKRENPQPLTLEELRKRDGKPVFAVDGEGHKCWVVVNATDECCADNEFGSWPMYFYNMTNAGSDMLHNMGWLAYDYQPKEEK